MLILASSKGQDFTPWSGPLTTTLPACLAQAEQLRLQLQTYDTTALAALMGISPKLAAQTREQLAALQLAPQAALGKPALFAFAGAVYQALQANSLQPDDLHFAQKHLRILSGLYGCLRPLDLIEPYRLEMATPLEVGGAKNLTAFWAPLITASLNQALAEERRPLVFNLASVEYSRSIVRSELHAPWIDIQFKEERDGACQVVTTYAKQARGLLAGFILQNRIQEPTRVRQFTGGGYRFRPDLSQDRLWVFTRPRP